MKKSCKNYATFITAATRATASRATAFDFYQKVILSLEEAASLSSAQERAMENSSKRGGQLTQFWELFTVTPCAPLERLQTFITLFEDVWLSK